MNDFAINTVVVCDDVRREMSQKDILVGAYGSAIVVHSLPAQINLAFWIELDVFRNGLFEIFLKLEFLNSPQSIEFKLGINVEDHSQSLAVFTPQMPCRIEREGQLRLLAKSSEVGKYKLIKSRKLIYNPNSSLVFAHPPSSDEKATV